MSSQMQQIGGLFLPATDGHFAAMGDAVSDYQRPQREKAFEYVTDWSIAVDVGAHCGIFSRHFATRFSRVLAFEPLPELRECLHLNVPANVEVWPYAVSDTLGACTVATPSIQNSGGGYISSDARVEAPPGGRVKADAFAPMITIDSLDLPSLGLLKVDAQGSDLFVLMGAADTLLRCRPVLIVEEKPIGGPSGSVLHIAETRAYLASLGAQRRERVGADSIFTL